MLVGYARVSKADHQDTAAQVKALRKTGCERIFEEKASGGRWDRPQPKYKFNRCPRKSGRNTTLPRSSYSQIVDSSGARLR